MWGILTTIDLEGCDPEQIRSEKCISAYVKLLVELIDMKAYGECKIVHFGDDPKVSGFTMVQMIETSLISGHFVNQTNQAYIDIFSCKDYDSGLASKFTQTHFRASKINVQRIIRGA